MKTLILLFVSLCLSLDIQAQSSDQAYNKSMKDAVEKLDGLKSSSDLQVCKNSFERISKLYDTKWLPIYYVAYCNIELVYWEKESAQNKLRLEEAEKHLKILEKMKEAEVSEVENLWGYYYMCLISRDPENMGRKLFQPTITKLENAIKLNPNNPRPIILLAFFEQNLPPFMKSKRNVLEEMKKAEELFNQESENIENPYWGKIFTKMIKIDNK